GVQLIDEQPMQVPRAADHGMLLLLHRRAKQELARAARRALGERHDAVLDLFVSLDPDLDAGERDAVLAIALGAALDELGLGDLLNGHERSSSRDRGVRAEPVRGRRSSERLVREEAEAIAVGVAGA